MTRTEYPRIGETVQPRMKTETVCAALALKAAGLEAQSETILKNAEDAR